MRNKANLLVFARAITCLSLILTSRLPAQNKIVPLTEPSAPAPSVGGVPTVEKAIASALAYLKAQQKPDGSWGETYACAMTGLAVKALLISNPVPDESVTKGAGFLLATATAHPKGIVSPVSSLRGKCVYENSIGLDALARFLAAGGKASNLENAIRTDAALIVQSQGKAGSWSYGGATPDYDPLREDISVTWWHYHALKSVESAKLNIAGLPQAFKKAEKYLTDRIQSGGGIGHPNTRRGGAYSEYTMTGPALSVLAKARPSDRATVRGAKFLLDLLAKEPADWTRNANLYSWYGSTLGLKSTSPTAFKLWTTQIVPQLLKYQNADGSWAAEKSDFTAGGSSAAEKDADVYRACLCILMLQQMGK